MIWEKNGEGSPTIQTAKMGNPLLIFVEFGVGAWAPKMREITAGIICLGGNDTWADFSHCPNFQNGAWASISVPDFPKIVDFVILRFLSISNHSNLFLGSY